MSMTKFDLQKAQGNKIRGQHTSIGAPGRFAGAEVVDRRESRKRDQELGLLPFACKLPATLVEQLRSRSAGHAGGLNALVAELLAKSLAE
ncbi:hypothetical protein GCM10027046_26020 [Uliginosibacterium flavum]|uniref:Toxin-antitoxin system HicB family antitoxin n=1 Tax=Uliginosibacterium flavum TaxID=1396831 RepID=A0ABV2TPA9_9RHOO